MSEVKKYAGKIQSDIMTQWNNPVEINSSGKIVGNGQAMTEYGGQMVPVVFEVNVVPVSLDEAKAEAQKNNINMDYSLNFMELVNDGSGSMVTGTNTGMIFNSLIRGAVLLPHMNMDIY